MNSKEIYKELERLEAEADALKDQLNKLYWREEVASPEDGEYPELSIIREILSGNPKADIEFIGGIDVETEDGDSIDTDKELDTFFDYKEKAGVSSMASYALFRIDDGSDFLVYNYQSKFSGSETRVYRIIP